MSHRFSAILCSGLLILCTSSSAPGQQVADLPGAQWFGRYPNQSYYQGLALYRDGNVDTATEAFQTALAGCLRDTNELWIDAIPVHAMLGECFYQAGNLRQALTHIETALSLLHRHRDWLERFDWPSAAVGLALPADERSGWIAQNQTSVLAVPDRLLLASADPQLTRSRNARPILALAGRAQLDAVEIYRGAALASYRRRLILGELADQTSRTSPAPRQPDQPTSSLAHLLLDAVDRCHELACGQPQTAEDLESQATWEQSIHPLTPVLLLAAARVAAEQDQFAQCSSLAKRAAEAAGLLGQPEFIAEGLLLAVGTHEVDLQAPDTNYATVAVHYLRRGRMGTVGALLAASETALQRNDPRTADEWLKQARALLQRRGLRLPRLAAHSDYLVACLAARNGAAMGGSQPTAVDEAVQRLRSFARGPQLDLSSPRTPRCFQMNLALVRSRHRGADPQQTETLLERVIRDPPTWLWKLDPVDALSFQLEDRSPAVAAKLSLVAQRDDLSDLAALADALLRYRYLAQLPLGGRVQQVRWIASAPAERLLGPAAELRAEPPENLQRLINELAQQPRPADPHAVPSATLESLATQIALDRSALPEAIPPPLADQIENGRTDAQTGMLVFVDLGERYQGLLIHGEQTLSWSLPPSRTLSAEVLAVLRAIGVPAVTSGSRLSGSQSWPSEVVKISRRLVPVEHHATVMSLKQLIIVPDGVLWYLPMELLVLQGDTQPAAAAPRLGELVAIRYCPTLGLALSEPTESEPQELFASPDHPAPLERWMRLPLAAPHRVLLPALQSAAEDTPLGSGRELFMTLATLRCSGAQEVLVSRWAVGGESTAGLLSELRQELPFTGLRPAWQRAVQLLRLRELDPQAEPLLMGKDAQREQVAGEHPLFWAGYLLDAPFTP